MKPNLLMQRNLRKVVRKNNRIEKRADATYLWDADTACSIISANMQHEAGMHSRFFSLALFIAYRLKFADDKTIAIMRDAILNHKKHYTEKISGDYTIYETMQINNCDFYTAVFLQYKNSKHAKKSHLKCNYMLSDVERGPECVKVKCSKLSEDGTRIIYMSQEDWEKEYGPVTVWTDEVDKNDEKMQEWINKFGQPIGPLHLGIHGGHSSKEEHLARLEELEEKLGIKDKKTKQMKKLSISCLILAILSSNIMCARVAYEYCNMEWGIKYAGYSAPKEVAFLVAIPYIIGIIICICLYIFFKKKIKK